MITNESLDARYLTWLENQIAPNTRNPARSYRLLVEQSFKTEFLWSVLRDKNRLSDGLDLRDEFLQSVNAERDINFLDINCSVLEMLVALCRRLTFETNIEEHYWFLQLLENLSIAHLTDEEYMNRLDSTETIDSVWHEVVYRNYKKNGDGGLFPLKHARENQREVEIWYQMSAYLLENNYI